MPENPICVKNIIITCNIKEGVSLEKLTLSNYIIEQITRISSRGVNVTISSLMLLKKESCFKIYCILTENTLTIRPPSLKATFNLSRFFEINDVKARNISNFLEDFKKDINDQWDIYAIPK